MNRNRTFSGKAAARFALSLAGLAAMCLLLLNFTEPSHQYFCMKSVDLLKKSSTLYKEVDDYRAKIEKGAIDEDKNERPFNHFYNRVNGDGLLYHSYYQVMAEYYKFQLPVPNGQPPMFTNALTWAKVAGTEDFNWNTAINYYSYTGTSRVQSYTALGHVVHCMQDMGEPDHAKCTPHPGSSMNDEYGQDETMEGYEMYFDKMKGFLPDGKTVKELATIEEYFNGLAEISTSSVATWGLPESSESAMGLKNAGWEKFLVPAITMEWDPNINIPWIGNIKPGNTTNKYYLFSEGITDDIIEYGAGLIKLFYDIVNPPPYVKQVSIYQLFGQNEMLMYRANWVDIKIACPKPQVGLVRERNKETATNNPLYMGWPTRIEIEFGPVVANPGEQINEESVVVRFAGLTLAKSLFTQSTSGTIGTTWYCNYFIMPAVASATLEVEARDLDQHMPGRNPKGDVLDSDPRTAAYVEPLTGYPWAYYEPGTDKNHTVIAVSK